MTEKELTKYLSELLSFELEELKADKSKAEQLLKNHLPNIPDGKLYKYRKCSDDNFELLKNRQIWIASPTEFPDKFDFTLKFDLDKNRRNIERWIRERIDYVIFQSLKKIFTERHWGFPYSQELISEIRKTCYTQGGRLNKKKTKICLLKNGINKSLDKRINEIDSKCHYFEDDESYVNEHTESIIKEWTKASQYARDNSCVYCMCESYAVDTMWQNYSGDGNVNYTGFCIEYDFSNVFENSQEDWVNDWGRLLALFPMIYKTNKGSANIIPVLDACLKEYFENDKGYLNNVALRTQLNLMILTKKKDYEYEHEWRMVMDKKDCKDNIIDFPYVNAIYLGKDISIDNEKQLLDIAKELNIKAYKQQLNALKTDYIYKEIKE